MFSWLHCNCYSSGGRSSRTPRHARGGLNSQRTLGGMVTVIAVNPLVHHSTCHSQDIKNPGEQRHAISLPLCPFLLLTLAAAAAASYRSPWLQPPPPPPPFVSPHHSHSLSAGYYQRVISFLSVHQPLPAKHMPDQRASNRPRVLSTAPRSWSHGGGLGRTHCFRSLIRNQCCCLGVEMHDRST